MKEQSFDQMEGVTFADFKADDAVEKTNAAIAQTFKDDPQIRATCPKCMARWEGTFEQITQHVEACGEAG